MNKVTRVDSNWYVRLLQDLKDLEYTGIVITKHTIGKRILQDELKFGKPEYGRKKIEGLAKDLNIRKGELWLCLQFAKKFDSVKQFEGYSWRYITHKLLPEPRPKVETPPLPKGKYNVIYADPPWKYDFCVDNADKIEQHYPTMDVEDIANIKIPTENNSVLYLWATAPKLREALYVMEEWGFEYKTNMTWDKEWLGMGYWFRGIHEHLLVGVKGNVPPPPSKLRVESILHEKRTAHSKKPVIIYEWIEKWYPKQKWIELFARQKRKGWISWGNEL